MSLVKQLSYLYSKFFQFAPGKVLTLHFVELLRSITGGLGILLIVPLLAVAGIELGNPADSGSINSTYGMLQEVGVSATLGDVLLVYLVIMLLIGLLNLYGGILSIQLEQSFTSDLRVQVYSGLLKAEWRYIAGERLSEFTRLLSEQVYTTGSAVSSLLALIQQVIMSGVYIALAFLLSPLISVLAIGCGLLLLMIVVPLSRIVRRSGSARLDGYRTLYQMVGEQLGGLKLIKSAAVEQRYIDLMSERSALLEKQEVELAKVNSLTQFAHFMGAAIVFSTLFYFAIEGMAFNAGTLVLLLFVFVRLLPQVTGIQASIQGLQHRAPAFEDLADFQSRLAISAEPEGMGKEGYTFNDRIELVNVSYSHPGMSRPVISGLNKHIRANTIVALTGPSGIGKSTLADIVGGLLPVSDGSILIDGKVLTDRPAWRRQVAYINQEIFFFNDSVRNNLLAVARSRDDLAESDLWSALELGAAAGFVRELPYGLDTVIGDRGVRISGGERQRLAIARALLADAPLLILDESTSELDDINVKRIADTLDSLRGSRTIILIAHNELPVDNIDQVIRLEAV